jgi:hypothetical protein
VLVFRTICSFLFLVGSFYYVSGSYPHASQFYYEAGRGHIKSSEEELAQYEKQLKLQNAAKAQKDSTANRVLRLSLTAANSKGTTSGYKELVDQDMSMDGHHVGDIEKGHAAQKKQFRERDKPVTNTTAGGTKNPLHNAPSSAASLSKPMFSPAQANQSHTEDNLSSAATQQTLAKSSLSPTKQPLSDVTLSPPVFSEQHHRDDEIHDENADDDDDDIEDDDEQNTEEQHNRQLDLLTSSMSKSKKKNKKTDSSENVL